MSTVIKVKSYLDPKTDTELLVTQNERGRFAVLKFQKGQEPKGQFNFAEYDDAEDVFNYWMDMLEGNDGFEGKNND